MIDKIIKFSIQNKLVVTTAIILLIICGVWSAFNLNIDAVPDITNNQVQIITNCPSLAAQEVEQLVTYPIEQALVNIPDIEEMRSISRFGLSVITIVFKDKVDIYFARQQINEKLKEAESQIPQEIGLPVLAPVSTGLGEIYQYIIRPKKGFESKYNLKELRTFQDWIVARQLYGTPGVIEVNSFGGELKQYEVALNPNRLKAMNVSVADVFTALEQNNQNTGGAYIDKKPNAYFIRSLGLIKTLEDVENIIVKHTHTIPIFIKDVAKVHYGHAIQYGAVTYNGALDVVGGIVMMRKGENSSEVVKNIKLKMIDIQKSLPQDILIEPYLDRTDFVNRTINTVKNNLIEGALIVIFILVLFLGSLRAGLIVASAIPLSLLFAFCLMRIFGVSVNLMSLGAIDFGLIVDGAVIIVEATLHHLGVRLANHTLTQKEMNHEVYHAASKIRRSTAFGEIIILIVYIPILTLIGIEGKMFKPMAQTVSFAIIGALIISLTYIPMMCAQFLPKYFITKKTMSDKLMDRIINFYKPLLNKAMQFKKWIITFTIFIAIVTVFLFMRIGSEFIPTLIEGDFAFHCILPEGTSLKQSVETSKQAMQIIKQFDEVKMVIGKTGTAEIPTDPMPPEATDMMIILKPQNEWKKQQTYEALANDIIKKLDDIPGVIFEINQPIQMRFNELMTGVRQDVAVKIFGENLDTLLTYANKVGNIILNIEGATNPQIERVSGLPQIYIEYDRLRIANYGLTIKSVNDCVSAAFAGKKTGVVYENERKFDLVVRLDTSFRKNISDVKNLIIQTYDGHLIPLSQVANINYKLGPAQITREAGKRRIVIGFNIKNNDTKSVVQNLQTQLNTKIHLPVGYYFTYGGTFNNLQEASQRLMIAVPISLLLIFVLLYFTFYSIKQALLIFTTIPMSAIGGVFALLLCNMSFSISAGVGFIALFGIAVLNGIVLLSTLNQLEKDGISNPIQRVMMATTLRLRPVLMTAILASLGFLPMAISHSAGSEVQKPLAIVVIGGLVSATLLTLIVLPILYILFNTPFKRINKTGVNLFLIVLMLCYAIPNKAQTVQQINIDEAIQLALSNNEGVKAAKLEVESSIQQKRTAFQLPKLNANLMYGQYNTINNDNAISVSQTIPFPTVFSSKRQLYNSEFKHKEIEQEVYANQIKQQVRSQYYFIEYLQFKQQKLFFLDSICKGFVRIAQLRFSLGDIKKIELSTAELKKGDIEYLLYQNSIETINAYKQLQILTNITHSITIKQNKLYKPLPIDINADTSSINLNPLIKSFYNQIILFEHQRKLEVANYLPDIVVGYQNQSIIGIQQVNGAEKYFTASDRFNIFNIGLNIPLSIGSAKAHTKMLILKKQAVTLNAQQNKKLMMAQYQHTINQYEQNLESYVYYQKKAMPNANSIITSAQLGYQLGSINYLEYINALQTATDIELKYLEIIHQINNTIIQIYSIINK